MAAEWKAMLPGSSRCCRLRRSNSSSTGRSAASVPQMTVLAGAFSQAISTGGVTPFSNPEGNLQFFKQPLHARQVEADRQHAAGAGGALLQGGAVVHQACRLGQ